MAGLQPYETVYRGKPYDHWESVYHSHELIRPLGIPQMHPLAEDSPPPEDDVTMKHVGQGCALAGLITENLLIHPFIVLRRQCQVNPGSSKYHLVPITLIPVMIRLHQTQGLNTLWKGIGSVLLVRGMTLAVEDFISKITPWPKELEWKKLKPFGQHLLLKCISIGIVTPFYSASLIETVQSEIASESPGILDVFRDGAIRIVEVGNKGRLIPIYQLLPPTILYGLLKHVISTAIRDITRKFMQKRYKHSQTVTGAISRDIVAESVDQDIRLQSTLISMCAADVLFYPFETVIHRLHLQGTRTIIDNLDTGRSVTPLLTGYSGAIDCYRTIVSTEGSLGLYKGFGALVVQFALHALVLRATKWIFTELGAMFRPKSKVEKKSPPTIYNEI